MTPFGRFIFSGTSWCNVHRCNKHILVGVSFNGEQVIVVNVDIVDYDYSLVGGKSHRHETGKYKVLSLKD